jgi:hypothetical protein
LGLGVNSALGLSDAFAIFNILAMLGVNTSGQERKNKLSFTGDGQYPINFEADITVRHHLERERWLRRNRFSEWIESGKTGTISSVRRSRWPWSVGRC